MRPIVKGAAPRNYSAYGDAQDDLKQRIGEYCNYCEMNLDHAAQVEHVQPKSLEPALELDWDNFLLACTYCNSTKSNKPIDLNTDIFPDLDNPLMAIRTDGVHLTVRDDVPQENQEMGAAFLALVGRDRDPHKDSIKRWRPRFTTLKVIERVTQTFREKVVTEDLQDLAIEVALAKGHFSMWLAAFDHDLDMKLRLIEAFPGTARNCFNAAGALSLIHI